MGKFWCKLIPFGIFELLILSEDECICNMADFNGKNEMPSSYVGHGCHQEIFEVAL